MRRASYPVRVFPRAALLLVVICLTDLARALTRIYSSVRYIKSRVVRGSPRWLEELENLVAPEIVKIVIGNKTDNVSTDSSPLPSDFPSPTPYLPTLLSSSHCHSFPPSGRLPTVFTHVCTPSRNTPDKCPRRSQCTGCLFIEASAKTAVGVTEAFNDVFACIIDMPSLWREEKFKSSPKSAASASANTAAAGRSRAGEGMPGNIDLSQVQDEDTSAGCLCSLCGFFVSQLPQVARYPCCQ